MAISRSIDASRPYYHDQPRSFSVLLSWALLFDLGPINTIALKSLADQLFAMPSNKRSHKRQRVILSSDSENSDVEPSASTSVQNAPKTRIQP